MKKIHELSRPFLAVIFGALLFLSYLNDLSYSGSILAMAIVWLVFAAFAITVGILNIVLGDKLSRKVKGIFDLSIVSVYALLSFVGVLLFVINGGLNAFSWVVSIIGMASTLGFGCLLLISYLKRRGFIVNLTFLFAALFALYLLVCILFTYDGIARGIGSISLVEIAIIFSYVSLAISVLSVIQPKKKTTTEVKEAK